MRLVVTLTFDVDPVLFAQDTDGNPSNLAAAEEDVRKYVPKRVDEVVREWERTHAPSGVWFVGYTL